MWAFISTQYQKYQKYQKGDLKMKAEVKKRWVEALCSGEYKKGIGGLHPTEDTYCCLGVLTDLYNKEMRLKKKKTASLEGGYLDPKVSKWAGFDGNNWNPIVVFKDNGIEKEECLANLNDCRQRKLSFKKIAKIIDKKL